MKSGVKETPTASEKPRAEQKSVSIVIQNHISPISPSSCNIWLAVKWIVSEESQYRVVK